MATGPNLNIGVPVTPQVPMVDAATGVPTKAWYQFFIYLWERTGGGVASLGPLLDLVISSVGAMIYRGPGGWTGLVAGAKYYVLRMGANVPEWDLLDGNSFPPQTATKFFASPSNATGIASFRSIATPDLVPLAGQYPGTATNDAGAAGNIGEFVSAQIVVGSAVVLASGTPSDIATITLSPGDWDVWGNIVTVPAGTTTQSDIKGWISTTSATDPGTPNQGAYAELQTTIAAGLSQTLAVAQIRLSLAAPTTVYLSTKVTFAISTAGAAGFLGARRAR